MRVSKESIEAAVKVRNVLEENGGRAADGGISLPFIASMAAATGGGDHCDIGTLYGASALVVAEIKRELKQDGIVYCIDPYDAEERDERVVAGGNLKGNVSATAEEFLKNAEDLELSDRIVLIQERSHPWPEELEDNVFASAYIDGDHVGDGPLNDFENLRGRTTHYIGTDNFEEGYPDVVTAMLVGMDSEDWFLWYKNLIFVALRRIQPSRMHQWYNSLVQAN